MASRPAGPCPVCDSEIPPGDLKSMKTHIILQHPRSHFCMFCLDKKGWSDSFSTQSSYNAHYDKYHRGIIKEKDKKRKEIQRLKKEKSRIPSCSHCDYRFSGAYDKERHLFSVHEYDRCKMCCLMGPSTDVRLHIYQTHSEELCYICCGKSPLFKTHSDLHLHFQKSHGQSPVNGMVPLYTDRLLSQKVIDESDIRHTEKSLLNLQSMRKRAPNRAHIYKKNSISITKVAGLKNESGKDCFAIAVLHLLAGTSLSEFFIPIEITSQKQPCPAAYCLLSNFFIRYKKGRVFGPRNVTSNYKSFGLDETAVDVGDFLRLVLCSFNAKYPQEKVPHSHPTSEEQLSLRNSIDAQFRIELQWKFECKYCFRYSVSTLSDSLIRLEGSIASNRPFGDALRYFFTIRTCVCGRKNQVSPDLRNKNLKYLFVEVDRSVNIEGDTKELSLYSLRLEKKYDFRELFSENEFQVIGSIHYLLDKDIGGGHYITNLYSPESWEESWALAVHERFVRETRIYPDFDTDAVVVALKKV